MKYMIILGDGMADREIPELGGRTPLAYADTPAMDAFAARSEIGMVQTIPAGMAPGSDTANLSVLGYDPRQYYTGRSPLEALSIGVDLQSTDVALRCNLVTLSADTLPYEEKTILDHSSGEIDTADAAILLEAVRKALETESYRFYTGTSYRHLTVWDRGTVVDLTPPHDILGQKIGGYLPKQQELRAMMEKSYDILMAHPINRARMERGLNPANSIWFWGAGTRPMLDPFQEKTGHTGVMISAVDLLKGIAVGAQMKVIEVPGANGGLHTNYEGKADAAVNALLKEDYDFAYIHLEAPDEMGHQGSYERKVQAIENLDHRIIRRVTAQMEAAGQAFRMLVLPDHPTPVAIRTHSADPVPYLLYDSTAPQEHSWHYNEKEAAVGGILVAEGHTMIGRLFEN